MDDKQLEAAAEAEINALLGIGQDVAPEKKEEKVEETEEKEGEPTETDKDEETEPKKPSNSNPQKRSERLLKDRNTWKQRALEAEKERDRLKNGDIKEGEYDSDRDADLDLVQKTAEANYAKNRISELEEEYSETFFDENPDAVSYKDGIMEIAKNNPQLGLDAAYKLYLAENHPEKLYDIYQVRKDKGGNSMKGLGSKKTTTSALTEQDLRTMPLDQLESLVKKEHAEGKFSI